MHDVVATDLWGRIAGLRLRFPAHIRCVVHSYRGRRWYVLHDPVSARYYRVDEASYAFMRRLDGTRTLQQIWDTPPERSTGKAATQDQIIRLVAQLHEAEILQGDAAVDGAAQLDRRRRRHQAKAWARWLNPLSLRLPLADPDRWLTAMLPMIRPLFTRTALALWTALVLVGVVLGIVHSEALMAHGASRALDPQNLLALCFAYPVIKALHEWGHAAATKVWGGEVHECGVLLLVFMPLPYVDASASCAFEDKWRRIVVGAAGIMVELFLAAVGLVLWLVTDPGLVRDMAFNVMLIGSVSTLLFNGNPLLRFDGYYILMDAIEIPNLGQRSRRYLAYLVKRHLFGLGHETSPVEADGERAWFIGYGVAAFCYRITIFFAIALYVAGKFFVVGVLLALWAVIGLMVLPAAKSIGFLLTGRALTGRRARAITVSLTAASVLAFVVFLLPVASWTQAEGIVQLPDQSRVTAAGEGFIAEVLAAEGQRVHQGDPLFRLEDPLLPSQLSVLEWTLKELEARQLSEMMRDRAQSGIYQEEARRVQAELTELQARMARQIVRSPVDGTFVVSQASDVPGRFVVQGEVLGYVIDLGTAVARVVIPQRAVAPVRGHTASVEIQLAHRPGESIPASIAREVPLITDRLPSRALGTQGGGAITVDARDGSGVQTLEQIYQLDVLLPPRVADIHVGGKVYVRFNHHPVPLARQWYRRLRQLFLSRLAI